MFRNTRAKHNQLHIVSKLSFFNVNGKKENQIRSVICGINLRNSISEVGIGNAGFCADVSGTFKQTETVIGNGETVKLRVMSPLLKNERG